MLFASGRRLFSIASIAMLLAAVLHTIANTANPLPADPQFTAMRDAMRSYHLPLGLGMTPSMHDIYRSLVFTMSVCLFGFGALGLTLATAREATPRVLSSAAAVFALASGALTVLFFLYRIPPPMIIMGIVTLLYAGAIRTTQSS